ncbi:transposase family protein [Streptomyces sp. 549]|uniref:transposase family protein n=1 Tax=Streptomyces sp. 549 TaxID=3049076 RepID=UPI0024C326C2|nr:transposase family protein [Streptomyces sp. 549]MDK1477088.1 transposase family protein [Streptomyces sp. 549]
MVTYRATLALPDALVSWVEDLIGTRRCELSSPWRALTSFDQAVMVLVYLAKGDTFAQLGAHFGVSTDTAWRYVNEGIDVLAAHAPDLSDAVTASGTRRRLLLDGTLIRTWRCAGLATETNPDPLYSGKHHDHGVNVQALTGQDGTLAFLGEARPGSTNDLPAARADGIITAVTEADVETAADLGYLGAGGTVRTPVRRPKGKGHNGHEKRANSTHATLRAPVERAFAALKRWRILDLVRISPNRITDLLHAILAVMQKRSSLPRA